MPKIIETEVFEFHELNDTAKEKARTWYRDGWDDRDWHEFVCEDFKTICVMLGVSLSTRPVRLMGGGTAKKPRIYFSGFWSQGDCACFESDYCYEKNSVRRIKEHAPKDEALHDIAESLEAVQRRNFYQLLAYTQHRGRYYHEFCMRVVVERRGPHYQDMTSDAEDVVTDALRDLARWLYRQLEREWEHQTSDENVDENIRANGYTFMSNGRRFG
jgi:hypothetical protein